MSTIAQTRRFVVGVDTHAKKHVYTVLTNTGEHVDTRDFPTTSAGMVRAIDWAGRRTGGDLEVLWVIEGAASYGALLAAAVAEAGYLVAEAARMNARAHHSVGKSDPLDAYRIGAAVLPLEENQLRIPRQHDGVRASLQILVAARDEISGARTRAVNALTALVRNNDLGIDARTALTTTQTRTIAAWRARTSEPLAIATARAEATRLAKHITTLEADLAKNKTQMSELVQASQAAPLLEEPGFGPVAAAVALTVFSHPGRVRSEAAFASLAGTNPIPASSGNTVRHRLNRGGDRRLNQALHMVALSRMTFDEKTRAYVEKRRAEGKTTKEIRRCLKRYLARHVYKTLKTNQPTQNAA